MLGLRFCGLGLGCGDGVLRGWWENDSAVGLEVGVANMGLGWWHLLWISVVQEAYENVVAWLSYLLGLQ